MGSINEHQLLNGLSGCQSHQTYISAVQSFNRGLSIQNVCVVTCHFDNYGTFQFYNNFNEKPVRD